MAAKLQVSQTDIDKVCGWISGIGQNTRDLWNKVVPVIKEAATLELSDANPNRWKPLSQKYLLWKKSKGYPSTIGVRTGFLKESTLEHPDIVYADKSMEYRVVDSKGYFQFFHARRPLFKHTTNYIGEMYASAVRQWINSDIGGDK